MGHQTTYTVIQLSQFKPMNLIVHLNLFLHTNLIYMRFLINGGMTLEWPSIRSVFVLVKECQFQDNDGNKNIESCIHPAAKDYH